MASVRVRENKRKGKTVLFRSAPDTDADITEALSGSWGMFGIRVKTGHSTASRVCFRARFTISPTTDRLTLPFNAC